MMMKSSWLFWNRAVINLSSLAIRLMLDKKIFPYFFMITLTVPASVMSYQQTSSSPLFIFSQNFSNCDYYFLGTFLSKSLLHHDLSSLQAISCQLSSLLLINFYDIFYLSWFSDLYWSLYLFELLSLLPFPLISVRLGLFSHGFIHILSKFYIHIT